MVSQLTAFLKKNSRNLLIGGGVGAGFYLLFIKKAIPIDMSLIQNSLANDIIPIPIEIKSLLFFILLGVLVTTLLIIRRKI